MSDWNELYDVPEWSDRMWQRTDGLTLSMESLNFWGYRLVTLPENFRQDNQVIDHVQEFDEKEEAIQKAEDYMEEN